MTTTTIARSAPLVVLAVGVLFLAMTSAPVGAPAPQVAAESQIGPPTWQRVLDAMDRSLGREDITAAEIAWHAARGHAIRSRQWDAFLAVGAGALRIGDHDVVREPYRARAREAWLSALLRARQQGALDGVLSVAEAFGSLGDRDAVVHALQIADSLAARDGHGDAHGRVAGVRQRLLSGPVEGPREPEPDARRHDVRLAPDTGGPGRTSAADIAGDS
jgi:hypothetical protein